MYQVVREKWHEDWGTDHIYEFYPTIWGRTGYSLVHIIFPTTKKETQNLVSLF